MIDIWFKKDIEKIFDKHRIGVFIDESNEANFLKQEISSIATIIETSNELEELHAKYQIEKDTDLSHKYLVYTNTPRAELKFIREYSETGDCIDIKFLDNYVKVKVNKYLNLNINLPKEELISAAKVSVGKDETYWMDLSHKGSSEIFDLEKELLPYLDKPSSYLGKYDGKTKEVFFKKINELLGKPYEKKGAQTFAKEVVQFMLDSFLSNTPHPLFLKVYTNWLDSISYRKSFQKYLTNYKVSVPSDIFSIHPSHPFNEIDELWLTELGANINNKQFISNKLPLITQRNSNKSVQNLGIIFWEEVKILFEFDEKNINQISSFQEAVDFYLNHFSKVDGAIRKLYAEFIDKPIIIEPIQSYYQNLSSLFLHKWFKYIDDYKSNQTGVIQNIIDNNSEKTAIVVGDGVSWEFAQDIIAKIDNPDFKLTSNHLLAGLPSETEHNMSQLYLDTGDVFPTKKKRENYLAKANDHKYIGFIDLEKVNETVDSADYLICSYKDPDKLGETYQQKALKYFDKVADTFSTKIQQLLQNGYHNVYLITDHGYTLTGVLENSDKLEVEFTGKVDKSERFVRTVEQQQFDTNLLIEKEIDYNGFKYCYYAKRMTPFKTPGVYGFSHGGMAPQETVIPYLKWTYKSESNDLLNVAITNKADLRDVIGELFQIKLIGSATKNNLFSAERKVIVLFFSNGKKINESEIILIRDKEEIRKEYQFGNHSEIELIVMDALTKEQLDKVTVNKSAARDLGGL